MKVILSVLCAVLVAGCASSTTQYYEAVQKAAEANSAAAQSKFEALSKIAASGDGQAASAAVMALALTQTSTVQPIPQQSEAIQWASVLASPVTSLGMMWMQADSAKTMARYNSKAELARVAAESRDNQALYGAFVDTASAGYSALGNVDYTPFVDGMVTLGTAGIDGAVDLGTAGFDSNVTLGTAGINGVVDMGTVGVNGVVDMGLAGIEGVADVSTVGFGTLLSLDDGNNALLDGVWSEYTAAIAEIMANVPQVICDVTTNADGSASVNCSP